jgi:hypothetical protein
MCRWEYKVVVHKGLVAPFSPELFEDQERAEMLNRYGQEGWELVAVVIQSYRRDTDPTILYGYTFMSHYFRREVQPPQG